MECPACAEPKTEVLDTRRRADASVKRRRRCRCGHRFSTVEDVADAGTPTPTEGEGFFAGEEP